MTQLWPYLVYLTFALGGVAVYFLMPSTSRPMRAAGGVAGLAALAGAMVLCADRFLAPKGLNVLFFLSSIVAIVAAVKVVTHARPVYSALYFVLLIIAVTPLLILQAAEFVAIALVIIYAGAIMVTYVFVIMLAQQSGEAVYDRRAREPFVAVFAGFVTMAIVAAHTAQLPEEWTMEGSLALASSPTKTDAPAFENTTLIGASLMTRYVVALEIAGLLLLIAMIGAIAVSRKRTPVDETFHESRPPGQIGREVAPF